MSGSKAHKQWSSIPRKGEYENHPRDQQPQRELLREALVIDRRWGHSERWRNMETQMGDIETETGHMDRGEKMDRQ